MCGIAGFCNFHGSVKMQEENLEKMKQRMLHRGPDAGGSYISEDGKVALGHRRLSIVDLSEAGLQPIAVVTLWFIMGRSIIIRSFPKSFLMKRKWNGSGEPPILK